MNGIEKVAARIRSDAESEAEAVRNEASVSAALTRAEADRDAKALKDRMLADAGAEAEKLYSRLVAAADTDSRKAVLAVKQEMLDEAFAKAVEKLRRLPDRDYIRLLAALAAKASEKGTEEILMNPDDRAKFGEAVCAEANRLSGHSMTLSSETRPIVGGLILSQGRIEINCALDTLAARSRAALAVEAAKRLFN